MRTPHALALVTALALAAPSPGAAQQKRIYLAPDDHTDLIWAEGEAYYLNYFPRSLDFYLGQIDATAAAPSDQQQRWNTDGTLWLDAYEKSRTPAQFNALIARVRDGHIGVPMNTIVSTHGATPMEGVLRDGYYAGRLERRYGIKFELGIAQENQVSSYGLGALLSGSGARYFHKGVCQCGNVDASGDREFGAYWWVGADGSRILSKWMSLEAQLPNTYDRNEGPGGYAETYLPRAVVPFVSTDATFRTHWPYDVIGLIGQGWDYLDWFKDANDPTFGIPAAARDLSDASRRVISSNMTDFFRDFETSYGAGLPTQSVSFGNDWEVSGAALAAKGGRVKRAIEGLRAAEAMATIVSLSQPTFMDGRTAARDTAQQAIGLYFEHNMAGGGHSAPGEREAFEEDKARKIEAYTSTLTTDASAAFAGLIANPGTAPRVYAFNPLGWTRTDVAQAAAPGTTPIYVVDVATGAQVPAELVGSGTTRVVRFLASGVPSIGYKVYELRDGTGTATYPAVATFSASTLTSAKYTLHMTGRGAIDKLTDRASGRQLVNAKSTLKLNDLGSGPGKVTLERIGPVSATIRMDATGTFPRTVRATVYAGVDRVDIEDTIGIRFGGTKTFSFAFSTPNPYVHHEELGAVLRARLAPAGDYSARAFNSNYEWLTLNHFAAQTSGETGAGVLLSNADAYFMKLGTSSRTVLDQTSARIDVLAGRELSSIPMQANDNRFLYRFALQPITAYSQAGAMRMSLEHQNPLVAGAVTGGAAAPLPATAWSLVTLSDSNQFIWAVKPAEEGIGQGVIVRVWNQSTAPGSFAATIGAPYAAQSLTRATHIETDLPDQTAATNVAGNQIATFRLRVR